MVVLPGDEITREEGYLRGHGTLVSVDNRLLATVAGRVERVNALVSVRAPQARYAGEVGDVVVGRIVGVGARRWSVDVRARHNAVLLLSAVNLEGGEQRRRTAEDQLNMRGVFAEGDLVSAEVHALLADGSLSLHARSLEYGRLENGQAVYVPSALVSRIAAHFFTLRAGVDVILGLNGVIWLAAASELDAEAAARAGPTAAGATRGPRGGAPCGSALNAAAEAAEGGHAEAVEAGKAAAAARDIDASTRLRIARAANSVSALAATGMAISPEAIMDVYDESERLGYAAYFGSDRGVLSVLVEAARRRAAVRLAAERDRRGGVGNGLVA